MDVTINGDTVCLPEECSVGEALHAHDFDIARVVVEYNGAVLPSNAYTITVLKHGDILEILHFVGGG